MASPRTRSNPNADAAERVTYKFLRTLGISLGIIRVGRNPADAPTILNQGHFDAVKTDVEILLGRKWTESELLERVFQAYRTKRTDVTRISELVVGATPAASKKDPNRNLLEGVAPRRWHRELTQRTMPTISFSKTEEGNLKAETVARSEVGPIRESYTLSDLRTYWEDCLTGVPLRETGENLMGALSWTVENNDLADVLWSIDAIEEALAQEEDRRSTSVFDLDPYLKDQKKQSKRGLQWVS